MLFKTILLPSGNVEAVTVCPYKYKLTDFVSLYHVFVVRVCLLCDTMTDARRTMSGTLVLPLLKLLFILSR